MNLKIAGVGAGRASVEFRGPYLGTMASFQLIPRSIRVLASGIGEHDTGATVQENSGRNPRTQLVDATASIGSQITAAYLMPEPSTTLDSNAVNNPPILRRKSYNFHLLVGDAERDIQNCTDSTVTIHASELLIGNLRGPVGQQLTRSISLAGRNAQIESLSIQTANPDSEYFVDGLEMGERVAQLRNPQNLRSGESITLNRQLRIRLAELRPDYDHDADPIEFLLSLGDGRIEDGAELNLSSSAQSLPASMEELEERRQHLNVAARARFQASGDTERVVNAVQRLEQRDLRSIICGPLPTDEVTCVLCGCVVPNRGAYVWAAHIKKRSLATPEERIDENIAAPMCKIAGCDSLFEQGDVIVDDSGIVRANEKETNDNPVIRSAMSNISGNPCIGFSNNNARYYRWHRERHT